jgi:proteasome accessory factor A
MCEFAGFLKIGTTQVVLQMLEDGFIEDDFSLQDPVGAVKQISERWDHVVQMADGRRCTALGLQREFMTRAQEYSRAGGLSELPDGERVLESWEYALDGLEKLRLSPTLEIEDDPSEMKKRLDWLLKLWVLNRYRRGKNASLDDSKLRVLDLQYHNIDREQGIFYRLESHGLTEKMIDDSAISRFMKEPPPATRAYFRGKCIEKFPKEINLINWEVVGFDQGPVVRMIPLLNPFRGTREQFEHVFERCENASELLSSLEAR